LLYIFWGEDDFSIEEALQEIKNTLGDASMLSTNTTVMEGQKLNLNEFKAVGEAMPFLSEKRLVIVRGLLERFENREKPANGKKNTMSPKPDESQALAEAIQRFPGSTVLMLIDSLDVRKNSLKNNRLYQSLVNKAEVRTFPLVRGTQLSQWIQSRVNQRGASISQQATNLLMEIIGGNLHTMNNEIGKLVAYTGGRMIEEKDIRQVVSAAQEADIFAMVDAIMDRQAGTAEKILEKLLQNGIVPPQILVLLARQVQMLVQMKDLRSQKKPISEIQGRLGIASEFVWNKIYRRADKYTMDRLKEIYQSLLETDISIKTGRLDGDLALNLLAARLCQP
jgi:DNA polymerase III subunit delta